jgi:hypothetical protein
MSSGQTPLPLKRAPTPTTAAITSADLMSRIYQYADDSMLGRSAGSESNLKATAMIAAELKRLGLEPAGDKGTYFQEVMLIQRVPDDKSVLTLNDGAQERRGLSRARSGSAMRSIDGVPVVMRVPGATPRCPVRARNREARHRRRAASGMPGAPAWFVPRVSRVATPTPRHCVAHARPHAGEVKASFSEAD